MECSTVVVVYFLFVYLISFSIQVAGVIISKWLSPTECLHMYQKSLSYTYPTPNTTCSTPNATDNCYEEYVSPLGYALEIVSVGIHAIVLLAFICPFCCKKKHPRCWSAYFNLVSASAGACSMAGCVFIFLNLTRYCYGISYFLCISCGMIDLCQVVLAVFCCIFKTCKTRCHSSRTTESSFVVKDSRPVCTPVITDRKIGNNAPTTAKDHASPAIITTKYQRDVVVIASDNHLTAQENVVVRSNIEVTMIIQDTDI